MVVLNQAKNTGQTLIETLVALGAAVVVMTAISIATVTALTNAQFSKNQNIATGYAQEGIEFMRGLRNANYQSFNSFNSNFVYCLNKGASALVSQSNCVLLDNIFRREIVINKNDPSCSNVATLVKVDVRWSDGKCNVVSNLYCHQVELNTCLSDYGAVISP